MPVFKKYIFLIKILSLVLIISVASVAFFSCDSGELYNTVTDGELTFELSGSNYSVNTIAVLMNGTKKGVYKVKGISSSEFEDGSFGFELIDMNFDEKQDFRIVVYKNDEILRYTNYLQQNNGSFEHAEVLDSLINTMFDYESKTIASTSYTKRYEGSNTNKNTPRPYSEIWATHQYIWLDSEIVETEKELITFYSENMIYCIGSYKLNDDGILDVVDEKWLTVDDYNKKYGKTRS